MCCKCGPNERELYDRQHKHELRVPDHLDDDHPRPDHAHAQLALRAMCGPEETVC